MCLLTVLLYSVNVFCFVFLIMYVSETMAIPGEKQPRWRTPLAGALADLAIIHHDGGGPARGGPLPRVPAHGDRAPGGEPAERLVCSAHQDTAPAAARCLCGRSTNNHLSFYSLNFPWPLMQLALEFHWQMMQLELQFHWLMMQLELHSQLYRFVSCCIFNLFVIDIDLKSVRRVWDVFQWQMRNFFIRKSRKPKHRYTSDLLSFCDAFIRLVALFVYLFAER